MNEESPLTTGAAKKLVREETEQMRLLMTAVIVVLVVGFVGALIAVGGMIVNAQAERGTAFQNLSNQILAQNQKINLLIQECVIGTTK